MSVTVTNLQGGAGGGNRNLTYSDSLLSPDQPFYAGDNWLPVFLDSDTTTTAGGAGGLQAGINRTATGLQMTNPTGAGFLPKGLLIPFNYNLAGIYTRRQFVQWKVITNPGGISRPGGVCYCNANGLNRYEMLMITESSRLTVNRVNAGVVTAIIAASAATAYSPNDVVKMICDAKTTPGTTIVSIFVNGVLAGTFNDNSGSQLINGVVGLIFGGSNPGLTAILSTYSGGGL